MSRATKARVLDPIFHNRQVTPLARGRFDFHRPTISLGFREATVRESRYFISRDTHQRQMTCGLLPARVGREGSAFEDTEFSVAKQPCTETRDELGRVHALRWCPQALRCRSTQLPRSSDRLRAISMPLPSKRAAALCRGIMRT